MSKKICHRDQYKLNQILEQVKALSDVVDELGMALNDLKKTSLNENMIRETAFFESAKKDNKVDYVKSTGTCTGIDETHRLAKNTQICTSPNYVVHYERKRNHEPSIRSLTIYDNLKIFKNKIMKNIQNIRKTRRSSKSIEQCVTTVNQQELQTCVVQKEEQQRSLKDTRNEDLNKDTEISEELDSIDTSFTSDASAQTEIAICLWQENDDKSPNLPCRNVTENSAQESPISMISDERFVIHSDRFTGALSKNKCAEQTFLTNKIKKYKKCSYRQQCPYALYKLPCNKYKCSTPEKKVNDEINGLALEYLGFRRKNNFPTFINVDTGREKNNRHFADLSPVKIGVDESSASSLSVDLEVKICNDHPNSENIDEFSKRRRARTYIVHKKSMRKNDLITNFRNETESFFNIIALWKHINEKKEKIDEIIERKYINPEENHQEHQKYKTENFIGGHWSLKNKNKQVQCAIPALTTPILNGKISVKTSNPKSQQSDSLDQSYRRMNKRYTSFPKTITPRWMETNLQTQTGKCSYFNYLEKRLSFLDDYANIKNTNRMDENGKKRITKKNNCIIEMNVSSSQVIWPRIKRRNIYSVLQTKEDVDARSKKPLSQIRDHQINDWQNRKSIKTSYPFCCNHISAEKRKNLMAYLTDYSHFPSKTLNFDMRNVSGRLYNCFEKLEDINA